MSKPKTDGDHFRAINGAMDATWKAVKAARKDGLTVQLEMKVDEESDKPDWGLWIDRKISGDSP